jgi:hypothetical protein
MDEDLISLLQAAAPRAPERLWESPTRFWSILAFSDGWPDWTGREVEFVAGLPKGGRMHGTVKLAKRGSWIRFRDLPAGIAPVYLVLGRGSGPKRGCLGYAELTQHYGDQTQLIDLVPGTLNACRISPIRQSEAELLADTTFRWLLEMDQR